MYRNKKNNLLLILSVVFVFAYFSTSNGAVDIFLVSISFSVIFFALYVFLRNSISAKISNPWVKPSNIFLISYSAIAFQYIFDYAYGVKSELSLIYPHVTNKCLCLGMVGFLSFIYGYSTNINKTYTNYVTQKKYELGKVPFFLIIGQLLCFLIFLQGIGISSLVSGSAYAGGNELRKGLHTYMELLLYNFNAVIVVYVAYNNKYKSFVQYLKSFPFISLVVIFFYVLLRFLSGDRGPVIFTSLLLFLGYLYASELKVRLIKALGGAFIVATMISLVGIARSLDTGRSFVDRIFQSSDLYRDAGRFALRTDYEGTLFPPTEEIAGSYMITFVSVNDVECNNGNYSYGFFQLIQILNCIPFMNSFLHGILPIRSENFSSSAKANYIYFSGYERNWGVGTNALGDIYWDFGIIGVFICFIFIGKIFSIVDKCLVGNERQLISIYLLLFALMFGAKAVYLPRNTFMSEMRDFVWSATILWVCIHNRVAKYRVQDSRAI